VDESGSGSCALLDNPKFTFSIVVENYFRYKKKLSASSYLLLMRAICPINIILFYACTLPLVYLVKCTNYCENLCITVQILQCGIIHFYLTEHCWCNIAQRIILNCRNNSSTFILTSLLTSVFETPHIWCATLFRTEFHTLIRRPNTFLSQLTCNCSELVEQAILRFIVTWCRHFGNALAMQRRDADMV
jgi:hypothetical protein